MAKKREPAFASEAAMCAAFIEWAKDAPGGQEWTAYAETAGWDILMVHATGLQIGIQAKMAFNMKVLDQAVPDSWLGWVGNGPDYRAVLVPERDSVALKICACLGLIYIHADRRGWRGDPDFALGLNVDGDSFSRCHDWNPAQRCKLPAYVPDVPAGASGPVQLTKWKIGALRILARIDARGFVTKADFKEIRIDSRAWFGPAQWVVPAEGRAGAYVRGSAGFDKQHPKVFAEILAEEVEAARTASQPEPVPSPKPQGQATLC